MKKEIIHIMIFFFLVLSSFAQDSCKINVNIITNTDSALIFLDGVLLGKGEVSAELEIGNYEIVVMSSLNKWGSDVITDTLEMNNCSTPINKSYYFSGKTLLTSSPDAAVFHKDSLLGYTPLQVPLKFRDIFLKKGV